MISRLEAGYSAESTGRVDLADAVRDVVELYEPVAEEAGVALETDVEGAFAVDGNRELIGQALSNIVDNAIKYSADATGKPRGRGGASSARRATIRLRSPTMARAFPTMPTAPARHRALRAAGEEPFAAGLRPRPEPRQGGHDIPRRPA